MKFYKGELFCGPGGLSLAAKRAKVIAPDGEIFEIEHKWANDYDEDTCKTFFHNICEGKPELKDTVIHEDVRKLKIKDLPRINAFAFGFPCNDYSNVGETKGLDGEYGPLYTYGIKVLKHHKPDWFIAENVGGLQSANEGQAFIKILTAMEGAGYRLTPHLYKFEQYGVPQARHRVIIVGIRKDLGLEFKVPKAHFPDKKDWITSKQALEEPPIPADALNHEYTRHTNKVIEMLSYLGPGDNAWSEKIPEHLRLNVEGAKLSNIYKKLDDKAPAYTVTGSGGGGTHMYHYAENRALTNRERARLQTFPDDFEFLGGKESVRAQIGMAVPPDGAQIILEAVLKTFAGIEYEWEASKWENIIEELTIAAEKKKKASKTSKKKKKQDNQAEQTELELALQTSHA